MGFTDHVCQQEVWEAPQRSPIKEPYQVRRLLTDGAVRASYKRAQFVGLAEYEAADGIMLRDLFRVGRRRLAAGPSPARQARRREAGTRG